MGTVYKYCKISIIDLLLPSAQLAVVKMTIRKRSVAIHDLFPFNKDGLSVSMMILFFASVKVDSINGRGLFFFKRGVCIIVHLYCCTVIPIPWI